jgi:hypothetical protein
MLIGRLLRPYEAGVVMVADRPAARRAAAGDPSSNPRFPVRRLVVTDDAAPGRIRQASDGRDHPMTLPTAGFKLPLPSSSRLL